jgi:sugar/nucleoside kinase (ribokinase family)
MQPTDARVAIVGNVNADVLAWPASEVPPPGVERAVDRIELRLGGAAAITGAALARLGIEPIVVGCVGDDALGSIVLAELDAYGAGTAAIARLAHAPTGVCIAFEAPARDRSFLISLGSLAVFDRSMVPAEALAARFVLSCGYFNLPALRSDGTAALLAEAKRSGATTLLDTGWDHEGWTDGTLDEVRRLLPAVDVFLPNEDEAIRLSGERDPASAARALASISGGWAVVKRGARGGVAAGPDGAFHEAPAPTVVVVDSTGAGDAFNAGLLVGLAEAQPWPEALAFAVRVASTVVSRGSRDRYPARSELVG